MRLERQREGLDSDKKGATSSIAGDDVGATVGTIGVGLELRSAGEVIE